MIIARGIAAGFFLIGYLLILGGVLRAPVREDFSTPGEKIMR